MWVCLRACRFNFADNEDPPAGAADAAGARHFTLRCVACELCPEERLLDLDAATLEGLEQAVLSALQLEQHAQY